MGVAAAASSGAAAVASNTEHTMMPAAVPLCSRRVPLGSCRWTSLPSLPIEK